MGAGRSRGPYRDGPGGVTTALAPDAGAVLESLLRNPETLRHLAALAEARSPSRRARARLTPEGVEILADMLVAGGRPTIGFWRKNTTPIEAQPDELLDAVLTRYPMVDEYRRGRP